LHSDAVIRARERTTLASKKRNNMKYTKIKPISIKTHPELSESWVQDIIAEDPSVLGLGDIILRDRERVQPRAGRLDLLFQDSDTSKRYEVEIQLGQVDESHIIRTIEYWDIERKRYPQYEHCAVIIAEDITSRFLNILGLFNGTIPLIAIQMTAIETESGVGLHFTKVLDEINLGMPDEDEEISEPTDRNYWESKRSNKKIVSLVDRIYEIVKEIDASLELKYNKYYIGLASGGIAKNFALCKPKKKFMRLEIKLKKTEELTNKLEESGLILMDYTRWGRYRVNLKEEDITENIELIKELLEMAYKERN
jgi:predicted transport protein